MKMFFALNLESFQADVSAIRSRYPLRQVRALNGVYKGETERSYSIDIKPHELQGLVAWLGEYQQESTLMVAEDGAAWLIYCDGSNRVEELPGRFQQVERESAEIEEAYTEEKDRFYVVK